VVDGNGDGIVACDIGTFEFFPIVNDLVALAGDVDTVSLLKGFLVGALQKALSASRLRGKGRFPCALSKTTLALQPQAPEHGREAW
jgi:hypothetical protein